MADRRAHAPGMSPLQALIINRMRERGWSPKQVEDRGVAHATLHRYMNPVELSQPPRKSVLQSLATALDLPLSRVQQAAVESVSYDYEHPERPVAEPRVSLEQAIDDDEDLHPVARAHLRNQLAILRMVPRNAKISAIEHEQRRDEAQVQSEGRALLESVPTELPARKRTNAPRKTTKPQR